MIINSTTKVLYRFSVDFFKDTLIAGWCFHRLHKERPLKLSLYLDDKLITVQDNDGFREDLVAQKIHRTGQCGFSFVLPEEFAEKPDQTITLTVGANDRVLCRLRPRDRNRLLDHDTGVIQGCMNKVSALLSSRQHKILFMHIPKTAGTSFNSFARSMYPADQIITHIEGYAPEEYDKIFRKFSFISGHITVGDIRKYFPVGHLQLYSMIRKPYAQFHSHLSWLRKVAVHKPGVYEKRFNIHFQTLGAKYRDYDFSDKKALNSFVQSITPMEARLLDNYQSRYFLGSSPDKVEPANLDEIRSNLGLFAEIGLTEDYGPFQQRFEQIHAKGRKRQMQGEKELNRSQYQPLFDITDADVREILYPLVCVDLALYDEVVKKYHDGKAADTLLSQASR